jgi:glycosyltransferase involved in cell wall biosynthesis
VRVLFFTEGFTPATRFRVLQYLPHLRERGITATVSHFRNAEFPLGGLSGLSSYTRAAADLAKRCADVLTASRYDAVCMQRELIPWSTDLLERLTARMNRRLIFDFDDAIYLGQGASASRERKIGRILQRVRLATVANRTLAAFASRWTETAVLPMAVDTDHFTPGERAPMGRPVRIGWIGTPTNFPQLTLVRQALERVASRGDVECWVMSSTAAIPQLDGLPVRFELWSEAGERALLQRLDIGLVPLEDTPWTRGKFPIKLLQYMAAGVVPVCSPVGVIAEVVEDGLNGRLAAGPEDWLPLLESLIADAGARRRLGAAARETVEQRYSVRAVLPAMVEAFERVASC